MIGAGGISETHVRAARAIDGVEVVAVCGANEQKTTALAASAGAVAFQDLEAFLAHPMDIVAIGSPSGLHAAQATAAVRRGIHVLVEKPLDTTTAAIDALIAEADRAGVKAGVFFQERLAPEMVALKAKIESGELGVPLFASGHVKWYRPPEYYSGSRWRGTWKLDGGGALMNQGIHTVDALVWLMGPVARVTGRTATRLHDIEVEDTAAALLEFESGAVGTIEATTAAFPGFPRRLEVTGTKGSIVHEDPARPATVADATPHRRVFEDFIAAVRQKRTPACDARQGRRSVAIVEAIYRSAVSRQSEEPK
ncbi:MAG TPA: Gfo/Idh/MocA family oxidoreductase [Vicinamibacterales bacterium]|nr:Gfo/Idh/MocA family oxidoreductase [Vicinamibacterales bacterium]